MTDRVSCSGENSATKLSKLDLFPSIFKKHVEKLISVFLEICDCNSAIVSVEQFSRMVDA
jgi:hypothetical protein